MQISVDIGIISFIYFIPRYYFILSFLKMAYNVNNIQFLEYEKFSLSSRIKQFFPYLILPHKTLPSTTPYYNTGPNLKITKMTFNVNNIQFSNFPYLILTYLTLRYIAPQHLTLKSLFINGNVFLIMTECTSLFSYFFIS